jgi:hypothetical protein
MVEDKPLSLAEEVRRMTLRQLHKALRGIRHQMEYAGVGRFELLYEDLLVRELTIRDADISGWM